MPRSGTNAQNCCGGSRRTGSSPPGAWRGRETGIADSDPRRILVSIWYAVQTKPRSERLLGGALQRAGLESYCPRIREKRLHGGKKRVEEVPLFPGYLFVKFHF